MMVRPGVDTRQPYVSRHDAHAKPERKGNHMLKPHSGCQYVKLSWNMTHTVVRICPWKDPNNPNQWGFFRDDQQEVLGLWIRRYEAVVNQYRATQSFVLRDADDNTVDVQNSPAWVLRRSLEQAVFTGQANPAWAPLVLKPPGSTTQPPVREPEYMYFVLGLVLERGSRPLNPALGMEANSPMPAVHLSQTAGGALIDKCFEKDADGNFVYGDITDLAGGMFVDFHQFGSPALHTQPVEQQQPQQLRRLGEHSGAQAAGGGGRSDYRYEVDLMTSYKGASPALDFMAADIVRKVRSLDEIVHIATPEEQVQWICQGNLPADAIVFALGDMFGDFIPRHIYDQAQATSTRTSVPFATGGQTYGQQHGIGAPEGAAGFRPAGNGQQPQQQTQPAPQTSPAPQQQAAAATTQSPAAQSGFRPAADATMQTVQQPQVAASDRPAGFQSTGGATTPPAGPPASAQPAPQQVQPVAEQQSQPTYASGDQYNSTMAALQRARERNRAEQPAS